VWEKVKKVLHGICDRGYVVESTCGEGLVREVGNVNLELSKEAAGVGTHGGKCLIIPRGVFPAEHLAVLVTGYDDEQSAVLIKVLCDFLVHLAAGAHNVHARTVTDRLVTGRLVEEGDVVFAGQQVRVDVERKLGGEAEEREGLDCDVLAREGAVGALAPALVFECQERLGEAGATERVDAGQERANV